MDIVIIVRDGRFLLFAQRGVHNIADDQIDDREHRHAEEHPREAENARRNGDRNEHPEARNTDGIAENLGADDIAVHLLQNDDENDKIERLQRLDQQYDERARNRSDKGAEDRDDVRHADDRRNQRGVRHLHKRHADVAQNADNCRVDDLADDEAGENPVDISAQIQQVVGSRGLERRDDHLLRLRLERIFRPEDVDGGDQTDDEVRDRLHNRHHRRCERREDLLHIAQKACLDPVFHIALDRIERPLNISPDLWIILQHIDRPFFKALVVFRRTVDDARDALIELRQQHCEERVNDEGRENKREDKRDGAAQLIGLSFLHAPLFENRPEAKVDKVHDRVQQKCNHNARNERRENPPDRAEQREKARKIRKNHHQQNADKNDDQGRQTPFKIPPVVLLAHASSPSSSLQ